MRYFFYGLFLCAVLTSCGIKPGQVSTPDSDSAIKFPRTYPDTSHDPKPETKP